jgi:hypothetical protein
MELGFSIRIRTVCAVHAIMQWIRDMKTWGERADLFQVIKAKHDIHTRSLAVCIYYIYYIYLRVGMRLRYGYIWVWEWDWDVYCFREVLYSLEWICSEPLFMLQLQLIYWTSSHRSESHRSERLKKEKYSHPSESGEQRCNSLELIPSCSLFHLFLTKLKRDGPILTKHGASIKGRGHEGTCSCKLTNVKS